MKITLESIADKHNYYCSDSNYYSNKAGHHYDTFKEFYSDWNDVDVDMNLIFRWDVYKRDNGSFYSQVFIIHQRKGIFNPIYISSIGEDDLNPFLELMAKHWVTLKQIWTPISELGI